MSDLEGFRTLGSGLDRFSTVSTVREAIAVRKSEEKLVDNLKKILSETYVLYHTIHGFHWNLRGENFYEYHKLFDEIVSDVYDSIDPIAENIRKLGENVPFVMSQLAKMSSIEETGLVSEEIQELVEKFLQMNSKYIDNLKETFIIANNENEQGIANFIAERIDQHQKWNWFLKASLGEK